MLLSHHISRSTTKVSSLNDRTVRRDANVRQYSAQEGMPSSSLMTSNSDGPNTCCILTPPQSPRPILRDRAYHFITLPFGLSLREIMDIPRHTKTLGFYLHFLVETPAIIGFLCFPSGTLTESQPHAHGVIRQYGLLLTTTNIIVASVLFSAEALEARGAQEFASLARCIAGALALYHTGPMTRAAFRMQAKDRKRSGLMASPAIHLVAHAVCCSALTWTALGGGGLP